jgi:hypothetical protein
VATDELVGDGTAFEIVYAGTTVTTYVVKVLPPEANVAVYVPTPPPRKRNAKSPVAPFNVIVNGVLLVTSPVPVVFVPAVTVHVPASTDNVPIGLEPAPPARVNVTVFDVVGPAKSVGTVMLIEDGSALAIVYAGDTITEYDIGVVELNDAV